MATEYIVPDTYSLVSLAVAQAESDGPTDQRIIRVKSTGSPYTDSTTFSSIAWTFTYYISIESFSGSNDVTIDANGASFVINVNSQQHVRLKNLTLHGAITAQLQFPGNYNYLEDIIVYGATWGINTIGALVTMRRCEAYNTVQGVTAVQGLRMEGCYVHDCSGQGIRHGVPGCIEVLACRVVNNTGKGIFADNLAALLNIRNSVVSDNSGDGINMPTQGAQLRLFCSDVTGNGGYGINIGFTPPEISRTVLESDGNNYYGNTSGVGYAAGSAKPTLADWRTFTRAQTGRVTEDENSISVDPLLETDGKIASNSPNINAGAAGGTQMQLDGTGWTDQHHHAIGADGRWDVELDGGPAPYLGVAPVFAADSRLDADTVSTTPAEDANFPKANLSDDRVFTVFKPGSSATTVDIVTDAGVGQSVDVDYFGLVGHDLSDPAADGNGAVTLTFAWSDNGTSYTTIFSVTPTDDRVIFRTFDLVTHRYYRLRLTRAAAFIPSLGELQWGRRVEVPAGIEVGFDPEDERVDGRFSRSQSGNILGAVTSFSERRARVRMRFVANSFLRGTTGGEFGAFWRDYAALLKPFFFSWNPGNPGTFEKDAFFGVFDVGSGIRRSLQTQLATGFRNLELTVLGLKE